MPITARATNRGTKDCENANIVLPTSCTMMPIMIIRLAWPRSASGARNTFDTKPARNPTPSTIPRRASLTPYRSRGS